MNIQKYFVIESLASILFEKGEKGCEFWVLSYEFWVLSC
jgi:hypothetical protein